MSDSSPKSPKSQNTRNIHIPIDARIEIVYALLNQRADFARTGAECIFARDEIASLLKLSGDPWTAAMLAELANARWQADSLAESTNYDKVVSSLLGTVRTRDSTLRLMRRAVNRPIEVAMWQAQELLSRIQADKMPLTEAARRQMDEDLLGLQSAWLLYSDRLLAAYMQLRDKPVEASGPATESARQAQPSAPASAAGKACVKESAGEVQASPPMRRHTDCLPTLH